MGKKRLNNYTFGFIRIVFVPITVESLDFVVTIFAEFVSTYHLSNPRRFAPTKFNDSKALNAVKFQFEKKLVRLFTLNLINI